MFPKWRLLTLSLILYSILAYLPFSICTTFAERSKCVGETGLCHIDRDEMNVFVVGDTGGASVDLTATIGTNFATKVQKRVAKGMIRVARRELSLRPPDFVANVGDNAYWVGVDNVNDTRFEVVFEQPYRDELLNTTWYMIAGNHDHMGNVPAQIDYSAFSEKWTFPNHFYKTTYTFGQKPTKAEFLFLDTIVLCGNTADVDSRGIIGWLNRKRKQPNGPDPKYRQLAAAQWKWIEEQIRRSRADYLFVVGHYPIHSAGAHGAVRCIVERLDPLLHNYSVSAYFSGHDHNVQLFAFNNTAHPNANSMFYAVSGAGSRVDPREKFKSNEHDGLLYYYPHQSDIPWWNPFGQFGYGYGGFFHLRIREDEAQLIAYIKKDEKAFEQRIKPRVFAN